MLLCYGLIFWLLTSNRRHRLLQEVSQSTLNATLHCPCITVKILSDPGTSMWLNTSKSSESNIDAIRSQALLFACCCKYFSRTNCSLLWGKYKMSGWMVWCLLQHHHVRIMGTVRRKTNSSRPMQSRLKPLALPI